MSFSCCHFDYVVELWARFFKLLLLPIIGIMRPVPQRVEGRRWFEEICLRRVFPLSRPEPEESYDRDKREILAYLPPKSLV